MQIAFDANRQHIVVANPTLPAVHAPASLNLEIEVLEERIAPAFLDYRPATPCCSSR